VQEIHRKVLSSGENCLLESKAILSGPEVEDYNLALEMEKRGFGKAKEIVEKKAELESRRMAIERAKNVEYYALHYQQKYIPFEDMLAICKEYNLVFAADQHFIGSIPVRCQRNIVNFKLRQEDFIYQKGTFKALPNQQRFEGNERVSKGTIEWNEIPADQYLRETNNGKTLTQNNDRTHFSCNNDYFIMCAPKEMFENDKVILDGHEMKSIVEIREVYDPICLKSVKNGFLIVDVWGEEAAIEAMQNSQKLN
jgi:hypothetical protein